MLKKFLSILLLFVFIFNITGIFIVFEIEKAYIRKEIKRRIKAGIPDDELHFFSFSQEEYENLEWTRPDKEFRSDNNMYDIVRAENASDDSIHLYCVNDKEETILFAKLDEMIHKKMEKESHMPNSPISKVVKIFKLVYKIENSDNDLCLIPDIYSSGFPEINSFYSPPYLEHLTPPPNPV